MHLENISSALHVLAAFAAAFLAAKDNLKSDRGFWSCAANSLLGWLFVATLAQVTVAVTLYGIAVAGKFSAEEIRYTAFFLPRAFYGLLMYADVSLIGAILIPIKRDERSTEYYDDPRTWGEMQ